MCQALGGEESSDILRWRKEHPGLGGSGSITVVSCVALGKSDLSAPQFLHPENGDNGMDPAELGKNQMGLLLTGRCCTVR